MDSNQQIKKGALLSYSAIVFNMIAGFIYTPWMVSQIGKSDYGLYILVTAFLTYFVMDFGLGQTIARFITTYKVKNELEKINQLLGLTTRFYLFINILIFLILLFTYFFIENIFLKLTSTEIMKFKVVYLIVGGFSLISFPFLPLNGVLIAYERFVVLKLCDVISKVLIIVFMVIALLLGYKLYALVLINALVGIIIIGIKLSYIKNTLPIKINFKFKSRTLLKELFKFSFWVSIIGIAQRLLINIAPFILGIVSGTTAIAIFSIGVIIEGYTWTFANALNGLFLPKVSQLNLKENNQKQITDLMIRVGRLQLIIVGLLLIGLMVLGQDFIILWMGESFQKSYYVVIFLIAPGFIILTQEIAYTYLFVINELKYRAFLFIFAALISVVLSFILAPSLGALGCAIGIFIGTVSCHVIGMNFIYWKKIHLEIPRFFKECYGSFIAPLGLTVIIGLLLNHFLSEISYLIFISKALAMSLAYFLLIWSIGLNSSEKSFFKESFLKIIYKFKRN
jgi:O-antigen/teichoic acid export membrane protein